MTKVKLIVVIETDGKEVVRTAPEFLIGFTETLRQDELEEIAKTVLLDVTGTVQFGIRRNAPSKGIKIWPQEG